MRTERASGNVRRNTPEGTGSLKEALASGSPPRAQWPVAGSLGRGTNEMDDADERARLGGAQRTRRAGGPANATVLTVMIGQGPQADGHVPPVRSTGFVLGETDFEAARAFLHDALTFKQHSKRLTAEVLDRHRRGTASAREARRRPATDS